MRKLVILHFNPLELYPPAMNLLRHLAQTLGPDTEITVYTQATEEELPEFAISGEPRGATPGASRGGAGADGGVAPGASAGAAPGASVRIVRRGIQKARQHPLKRLLGYWRFYAKASLDLFRHRPDVVLSIETLSFLPAYVYKKWGARRSALMIHYHEYIALPEYRDGMKLQRWIHGLECRLYPRTAWVSHTNEERMRRFLADHVPIRVPHTAIIPNYPPQSWISREPRTQGRPLRVVYVGSVDLNTMYVREFADWVISRKGEVIWDVYALHVPGATREYLETAHPEWVRFRGSCYYYDLPRLLEGYDVGVVLYKGVMPNHIYAVSNKVLEYAVCGLDVWYAREMVGTYPYDTAGTVYPKIIPLDFTKMDTFDLHAALDRSGKQFHPAPYSCEEALQPLVTAIREATATGDATAIRTTATTRKSTATGEAEHEKRI